MMNISALFLCFYVYLCYSQFFNETSISATTRQLLSSVEGKDDNAIFSGNYLIINCGVEVGTNGQLLAHKLLPQFYNYLQDLLHDVSLGVASDGYKAFFKSSRNQEQVQRTILDISLGTNPPIAEGGQYPIRQPVLACVTPINHYENMLAWCQAAPERLNFLSYNVIFLCPAFFKLPPIWIVSTCPRIAENSYSPSDQTGLRNQYASFVQAMASRYLQLSTLSVDIQSAVDLDEEESARSASNYGYYAASKIMIPMYEHIPRLLTQSSAHEAGCQFYPVPSD